MFVDLILPLPLASTFTYRVPSDLGVQPKPGMRVVAPFGSKKLYTGIVYCVHSNKPNTNYELKEILCFLDDTPILRHTQLKLWEWVAEYYMSPFGDVYKAAFPSALKLESETKVCLNESFEISETLPVNQQQLLKILSDQKQHGVEDLAKQLGVKSVMPTLQKLLDLEAVLISEKLTENYKPKTELYIALHPNFSQATQLQVVFAQLNRSPKQLALLMRYLELSKFMQTGVAIEVSKKLLLEKANAGSTLLLALVQKGIFVQISRKVDRLDTSLQETKALATLNNSQLIAFNQINTSFLEKPVVLLHGVTSSGKTEVYMHLIHQTLAQGKQVLYLVPEIALTTQLSTRLQAVFGEKLGVYHSKFSDAERVEIYQNLLQDKSYQVVLGVRSSVFLPFRQLGLIIVDEEHEGSYKQQDPAPRYHARNVAVVLAHMHGAKTLLGTATPSVESYFNAQNGKYGLVEMLTRWKDIQLPTISVVNTKEAYRKKCMTGHFSDDLVEKMQAALSRKEQIILFQNRRGYAPFLECRECGNVPKCQHCDVTLTVHQQHNVLVCHYCGYTQSVPKQCPTCSSTALSDRGFGTEKIEKEIKQLLPEAKVARMDLDTTRTRNAYQKIISDFEHHKVDILVGTQMVSKGLNFEDVSLVAVLSADNLLHQPNFRSYERAFQMLEQVSGRAGRMHGQGEVILQTANPENSVIKQVVAHDYINLYTQQVQERKIFRYPPYYRLLQVIIKHRDYQTLDQASNILATNLQQVFGVRCSHVVVPIISRIQNLYIRQILLRIEAEASVVKAKELLQAQIQNIQQQKKGLTVYVDVDPI